MFFRVRHLLCILAVVVFVIQAEVSASTYFRSLSLSMARVSFRCSHVEFTEQSPNLKMLLLRALKVDQCARIVSISQQIPLRFRRAAAAKRRFQCNISLD